MNVLFTGITTLFTGTPAHAYYAAIGGRQYLNKAPQGATFPYVVYSYVSGMPEPTFTENEEEVWIQFAIYSEHNSATEAGTILAALYTRYDYCTLTVAGYNFISMVRGQTLENNDLTVDPTIHGYIAQYIVKIQKAR
jgi:hypothetical protein